MWVRCCILGHRLKLVACLVAGCLPESRAKILGTPVSDVAQIFENPMQRLVSQLSFKTGTASEKLYTHFNVLVGDRSPCRMGDRVGS